MIDKTRNKDNTKIGVIGLGLMGSGFLRRLNGEGWRVEGWNRSRAVGARKPAAPETANDKTNTSCLNTLRHGKTIMSQANLYGRF